MRTYLVVDSDRDRALDYIRKLNESKELENYVEHKQEAIAFYEDKKYFITSEILPVLQVLPIYGLHIHGSQELTKREEEIIRNCMIRAYGLDGVAPELPHVHRY